MNYQKVKWNGEKYRLDARLTRGSLTTDLVIIYYIIYYSLFPPMKL